MASTAALALLSLIGLRCERLIAPDLPDHASQLVAISYFSPEEPWSVTVRHSVGLTDDVGTTTAVIDARVEIYSGDALAASLHHRGEGVYVSDGAHPAPGTEYTLRITSPRHGSITATDAVPTVAAAPAFDFLDAPSGSGLGRPRAAMLVQIDDPGDERNYYRLDVLADYGAGAQAIDYGSDDPIFRIGSGELDRKDGARASLRVFDDALFDGHSYRMKVDFPRWPANSYAVAIVHLSEAYFRYARSLERIRDSRGNPFLDPISPRSNVEGGQGIFAGYAVHESAPLELGEVTKETIAGEYRRAALSRREGESWVPMGSSAGLELQLAPTGEVVGRMYANAGLDETDPHRPVDVSFTGTFEYDGLQVSFATDPPTFLQDAPWLYQLDYLTTGPGHERFRVSLRAVR